MKLIKFFFNEIGKKEKVMLGKYNVVEKYGKD